MHAGFITQEINLTGHDLTLSQVEAVARQGTKVKVDQDAIKRMAISRNVVEELLQGEKPVYGINTGFGALSQVSITREEAGILQNNLIISHAVGCGQPFPKDVVRAMLLLRANALCQGFSGIRPELVLTLVDMLNAGVHPVIPEKGSLGASGDLAPLSHMALVLLGLGEAEYQGEILPGQAAMDKAGIKTHRLLAKEGLALINGTQAMAAVSALAVFDANNISRLADVAAALTMEGLLGCLDAFEARVHRLRPHEGQQLVAKNLLLLCQDSPMIKKAQGQRVQDAYSLRCVPQVHGALRDALAHVQKTLETEFNSVTDNPLIFAEDKAVISGGNFHGEPLALALDYLAIAVAEFANISERRLERMVNPQLSGGLPAFLVKEPGLNSGMMIIQYTAASMVSENKVLAHPASVDSIPSSANQEDHVSMGMTAARKARQVVENTFSVLALELMAAAQAIDLRGDMPSKSNQAVYQLIREQVAFLSSDRELRRDVDTMNTLIRGQALPQLLDRLGLA